MGLGIGSEGGETHIIATDQPYNSYLQTKGWANGCWLALMHPGCGQLCFEIKVLADSTPAQDRKITVEFVQKVTNQIENVIKCVPNTTVKLGGGWTRFCISLTDFQLDNLPAGGEWSVEGAPPREIWSNLTNVRFRFDWDSSQGESIAIRNVCVKDSCWCATYRWPKALCNKDKKRYEYSMEVANHGGADMAEIVFETPDGRKIRVPLNPPLKPGQVRPITVPIPWSGAYSVARTCLIATVKSTTGATLCQEDGEQLCFKTPSCTGRPIRDDHRACEDPDQGIDSWMLGVEGGIDGVQFLALEPLPGNEVTIYPALVDLRAPGVDPGAIPVWVVGAFGGDQVGVRATLLDSAMQVVEDSAISLDIPAECSCIADFDRSHHVDDDDVIAFSDAMVTGDPAADLDGSGAVNADDADMFFEHFVNGC